MEDLMKIDLYELLGISVTAEEKDIKKAYRKKALTCHPDKNPDNPKAAQLFQQLSKALEVLTDSSARIAYDKVLNARKSAQIRCRELDGKRKKLKEDLESREKLAQEEREEKLSSEEKLKKEIERLRREGSKQLEEEQELMRQQFMKEALGLSKKISDPPRLKVKWKSSKDDTTNGGYSQDILENIFKNYGHITCLVSARKTGSAIIEFSTPEAAQLALDTEKGNSANPFILSWISGQPEMKQNFTSLTKQDSHTEETTLTNRDYESIVLMKLRQAEERKRLIQKMMEEDG